MDVLSVAQGLQRAGAEEQVRTAIFLQASSQGSPSFLFGKSPFSILVGTVFDPAQVGVAVSYGKFNCNYRRSRLVFGTLNLPADVIIRNRSPMCHMNKASCFEGGSEGNIRRDFRRHLRTQNASGYNTDMVSITIWAVRSLGFGVCRVDLDTFVHPLGSRRGIPGCFAGPLQRRVARKTGIPLETLDIIVSSVSKS